jgi:hypothetical protein
MQQGDIQVQQLSDELGRTFDKNKMQVIQSRRAALSLPP